MADEANDQELRKNLQIIQSMIDVSAERLEGLRTQCATSAELTQQEIRTLEGKLIKMFSEQLVTKLKLRNGCSEHLPSLTQWLQVVGLGSSSIQGLCQKISSVEELQEKSEHELKTILNDKGAKPDELSKLFRALHNLKRYVGSKFPTTPPPRRKHLTGLHNTALLPDSFPLTKSKSHESQLAASKSDASDCSQTGESAASVARRARLPTEPGPDTMTGYNSPLLTSPIKSPPSNNTGTDSDDNSYKSTSLQVPKSPRTPPTGLRNMTHQINHRFAKKFKMMSTCWYCQKPIYFEAGLKCKECKFTCHRECENKVTPSCGLPPELLDEFKKKISKEGHQLPSSPSSVRGASKVAKNFKSTLSRSRKRSHPQPSINIAPYPPPDSSSNTSSCNSSTPSSPAVQALLTPHAMSKQQFHFPDIVHTQHMNDVILDAYPLNTSSLQSDLTCSQLSRDSDRTISISGSTSTDSDRTPVRVDSQDSQVSDTETITDGHRWPRQNSLSMREWDIPHDELTFDKLIGIGRFGKVYRGYWHGDVAIKVLKYLKDEKTLEHFKMEVATFRKTRHENLILFMGACMNPEHLAIVTSLSKGDTLYTHIHLRKDKFNMNRTTIIAQQISQGMGYLHAKGIVHKDLKSKNIFLENGKVVITDFGLFSVTKLCYENRKPDSLGIPPGWLCYLAPEIVRSLHAHQSHDEELPFSKASDVYAFGTVWYELLCGEWPFKAQPPEAIIWQVGKGMKQPLANLQASRDVKDILMLCWSFRPGDRPDFSCRLLNILEKLPKKRLARSPSHPIHLSRSAESVF
ncbi:kinase suppressor of Ras 1 isoform X2 [Harmonia axyridis]|uniref:kinase suppressor of Ras 1 isoform X2 n=1 Tax=Harmonia axyridis TaxID=115357 RepID=UPI001E278A99|nr:kinase suppressor of Ras 1 isoform X2 [Harmonia axyridis]